MRLARKETRKRRNREDVILFSVGASKLAISARAVEKIEHAEVMKPLASGALRKVRQMFAHPDKTYVVVDAATHLCAPAAHPTRLLLLRDSDVALAVDSIERMAEIAQLHSLPHSFTGDERKWYRGLALIDSMVIPVLNPEVLLSDSELAQARAAVRKAVQAADAAQEASA